MLDSLLTEDYVVDVVYGAAELIIDNGIAEPFHDGVAGDLVCS